MQRKQTENNEGVGENKYFIKKKTEVVNNKKCNFCVRNTEID